MSMEMQTSLAIVLVSPKTAENVGAVARVAANCGVADLRLVCPRCDPRSDKAEAMACQASLDILRRVQIFETLSQALHDCHFSVGFTGKEVMQDPNRSRDFDAPLPEHFKSALVFGREDDGLTADELAMCHAASTIPTHPFMPSLNLSHAVALVVHAHWLRLCRAGPTPPTATPRPDRAHLEAPATHQELLQLETATEDLLRQAGFTQGGNPEKTLVHISSLFRRGRLTRGDVQLWRGLWSRFKSRMTTGSTL